MKGRLLGAWLLALMAATMPLTASAQKRVDETLSLQIDKARIDRALSGMVRDGRAAGASALVWHKGREVYYGETGFADREAKRPMRRDTLVQIYSMTKPVTGVALMQLWEQGRFGLDDPLSRYLPEYANMLVQDGTDANGKPLWRTSDRPITIRDIFRHTAGFTNGLGPTEAHREFARQAPMSRLVDLSEFGRRLARVPLQFDPGQRWDYSLSVDVQALLVEKLSGQPFEIYVQNNILKPLKMTETGWSPPNEYLERLAATYILKPDGTLDRQDDAITRSGNFPKPAITMGGAGLVSSIDNYMRFARMLLNGGTLDGAQILKASTIKLMATDHLDRRITNRSWLPSKGNVGFGFDFAVRVGRPLSPEEPRGAVGEYFWDGAASTLFWVDPVNDLSAVYFVQTRPNQISLARDIRAAIYGPNYLGPKGD